MKKILIIFAHPVLEKSRVHKTLLNYIGGLDHVTFIDLYEQYPDFDIDIKREQQLLLSHDIIIWQHPLYWYSAPALLKQWQDLVLEHGWAYGRQGHALTGKKVFNVLSSGGGPAAYQKGGRNEYPIQQFLIPFERTAVLCRMTYWPPFWIPGVHKMMESEVGYYAQQYQHLLKMLTEGLLPEDEILAAPLLNNITALTTKQP